MHLLPWLVGRVQTARIALFTPPHCAYGSCVVPPICLSCTIQWPGSGPCTSCSARNGEVHTPCCSRCVEPSTPLLFTLACWTLVCCRQWRHWRLCGHGQPEWCLTGPLILCCRPGWASDHGLCSLPFINLHYRYRLVPPSSSSRHWLATSNYPLPIWFQSGSARRSNTILRLSFVPAQQHNRAVRGSGSRRTSSSR